MASSLLFKIKSVFVGAGLVQAQGAFTATLGLMGRLVLIGAKLAFTWETLGISLALLTPKLAVGLVGVFTKTNEEALRAENSFARLRIQLGLIGQASEQNLGRIRDYAQKVVATTQFSATSVEEAVTIALRRTNNVNTAIREVSVAQDMAAATGLDLSRATTILNAAQAGNYRTLLQLTNLRRADLEAAVRQGTVIDLLANKFKGAAAQSADTLATKLAILRNVQEQLREEIGKFGLPFNKFVTDIRIFVNQVLVGATRGFEAVLKPLDTFNKYIKDNPTFLARFADNVVRGKSAIELLGLAMTQAAKDSDDFNKKMAAASTGPAFNFGKEYELNTIQLTKSTEEYQNALRLAERADEILEGVRSGMITRLTKEHQDVVNTFQYAKQDISDILQSQTTDQQKAYEKQIQNAAKLKAGVQQQPGIAGQMQRLADFEKSARSAGLSVSDTVKGLQSITGLSPIAAKALATIATPIADAANAWDSAMTNLKNTFETLKGSFNSDGFSAFSKKIANIKETKIEPNFQIKFLFETPPEAVQIAVRNAVNQMLPSLVNSFVNSVRNGTKEAAANSSAR